MRRTLGCLLLVLAPALHGVVAAPQDPPAPRSAQPDRRAPRSAQPDRRAPRSARPDLRAPRSPRLDRRAPRSARQDPPAPRGAVPDAPPPRKSLGEYARGKIDPQLLAEIDRRRGTSGPRAPAGRRRVAIDSDGRALVEIRGRAATTLHRKIARMKGTVVSTSLQHRVLVAWVPLSKLELLAREPIVSSIDRRRSPPGHAGDGASKN